MTEQPLPIPTVDDLRAAWPEHTLCTPRHPYTGCTRCALEHALDLLSKPRKKKPTKRSRKPAPKRRKR